MGKVDSESEALVPGTDAHKKQALLDMIDQGLQEFGGSDDEASDDGTRSDAGSILQREAIQTEEDEILK